MITHKTSVSARQPRCGECVIRQESVTLPVPPFQARFHYLPLSTDDFTMILCTLFFFIKQTTHLTLFTVNHYKL